MPRFRATRLMCVGLLCMWALVAGVAPAHAKTAPEDDHARPTRSGQITPADFPASIDSDVYAYAVSPNFRTYFVASGHLTLTQMPGKPTAYKGFLVDYDGNKAYPALADTTNATNPTLTINSRNGKFSFMMDTYFGTSFYSGTGSDIPKKLGLPANQVYFAASTHSNTSVTYNIILSQRVGPLTPQFEYVGAITFVYDANNRISGGSITVPNNKGVSVITQLTGTGYYSTSYLYTSAKINGKTFGLAATFSGTSFSGNAFSGGGNNTSLWVWSGTPA